MYSKGVGEVECRFLLLQAILQSGNMRIGNSSVRNMNSVFIVIPFLFFNCNKDVSNTVDVLILSRKYAFVYHPFAFRMKWSMCRRLINGKENSHVTFI